MVKIMKNNKRNSEKNLEEIFKNSKIDIITIKKLLKNFEQLQL